MDKLGLYINNLMATIVDREDKYFVRKLAFNELQKLNHDVGEFLIKWDEKFWQTEVLDKISVFMNEFEQFVQSKEKKMRLLEYLIE